MTSPVESMLLRRLAAKKKSSLLYCFSPIPFRKKRATFKLIYFIASFHFTHIASTPDIDRILYIEFSHHLQQTSSARNHRFYDADRCCARLFVFLLLCFNRFAKPFFNDVPISAMERLLEPFFSCWLRPKFNHVSRLRRDVISHNSRLLQVICGPAKR